MKEITAILPARGQIDKIKKMMNSFRATTNNPSAIEILVAIDNDDVDIFPIHKELENEYKDLSLKFLVCNERSEHFTKYYWNPLAKMAQGRWIFPVACDHEIITNKWDKILIHKMNHRAETLGDDIIHGLIKDNIKRVGEDKFFPNFSCHPVQSKEHIKAIGYFFDERYWAWGPDHAVSWMYRMLEAITHEKRIVSLTDIEIITDNPIHVNMLTKEEIDKLKEKDKSYIKFQRIHTEHPCNLTAQDYLIEAEKLKTYINRNNNIFVSHGPCGHPKN